MGAGIPDFESDSGIMRSRFGIPEIRGSESGIPETRGPEFGIPETACSELGIPIYIVPV